MVAVLVIYDVLLALLLSLLKEELVLGFFLDASDLWLDLLSDALWVDALTCDAVFLEESFFSASSAADVSLLSADSFVFSDAASFVSDFLVLSEDLCV